MFLFPHLLRFLKFVVWVLVDLVIRTSDPNFIFWNRIWLYRLFRIRIQFQIWDKTKLVWKQIKEKCEKINMVEFAFRTAVPCSPYFWREGFIPLIKLDTSQQTHTIRLCAMDDKVQVCWMLQWSPPFHHKLCKCLVLHVKLKFLKLCQQG